MKDFNDLYQRFTNGHIAFDDKVVFFTQLDRTAGKQLNDASSEGCTVIDTQAGTQLGVLHIHLELHAGRDVITKAHVKDFHHGTKLFDLSLHDNRAAIVLATAYGGSYSVLV